MGRIGVDLYPQQIGVSLREVTTFGKFLGGSPTNVAVAAARYGRRSAVITRTGDDPFGEFLHDALRGFGVDDRYVTAGAGLPTPVTFCEIFPPDDFPLYFYRFPKAPDLEIRPSPSWTWTRSATPTSSGSPAPGCPRSPAADGHPRRAAGPRPARASPCSTWTTGRCSGRRARRPAAGYSEALPYVTVAVGNLDECDTAVGVREPRRPPPGPARRRASSSPWSSRARPGCWPRRRRARCEVPPVPVEVVNGLGAGRRVRRRALPRPARPAGTWSAMMRFCNAAGAIVAARLACADAMPTERRGRAPSCRRPSVREDAAPTWSTTRVRPPGRDRRGRGRAGAGPTSLLGEHGRLMMIAADHPARGALRAGADPLAMADRADLLDRICAALARPGVNGVLGTPDILEDLLLLGALDDKVVIGSMNRGGLAGTVVRDRRPVHRLRRGQHRRGRVRGRQDAAAHRPGRRRHRRPPCRPARGPSATWPGTRLMAMVEPFISHRVDGRVRNELTAEAMIRAMTVAAGLGTTSAYTWLKVPIVDGHGTRRWRPPRCPR